MSTPDKIYAFNSNPGIQRDGTTFSTQNYTDGNWCRWYRGLPKKMGGYSQITDLIPSIPRGIVVLADSPNFDVYIGDSANLFYIKLDPNGNPIGPLVDRTPVLFPASVNNVWKFDIMYSTVDAGAILIAHAAPNLASIDSNNETEVWYGEVGSNLALQATGFSASGGIVVLHPYLFIYSNDGSVIVTNANDPTTELDSFRVTGSKIVAGLSTRGGNSSPAGLLWSLDSVIRVTNVGTVAPEFSFDTVSAESSILSSSCVIEYDSEYYWAGVDRFLLYNGTVQELPNSMSLNYFFSNLNMAQRQKVWATKITKWGEIWWHFPTGNSEECNHAVVYNVREKSWYDTPVFRSCGYFDQTFSYPIWAANTPNNSLTTSVWSNIFSPTWENLVPPTWTSWSTWPLTQASYSIWQHEYGLDQNINNQLTAIPSYFESGSIAWVAYDATQQRQNMDRWVYLYRVEPDMIQAGPLFLMVNGKEYARSPVVSSTKTWSELTEHVWQYIPVSYVPIWFTWGDYVFNPDTLKIDMREQRREMTLKFVSNSVGGYYELGQTLLVARIGDARQ